MAGLALPLGWSLGVSSSEGHRAGTGKKQALRAEHGVRSHSHRVPLILTLDTDATLIQGAFDAASASQPALPAPAAYHFYPSEEQVRAWLDQAEFAIEEEGTGDGYFHFLARKKV